MTKGKEVGGGASSGRPSEGAVRLDHLVATVILGWVPHPYGYMRPNGKLITHQSGHIPKFSQSWAGLEWVVSAIEEQGYSWWLEGSTNWPKTATVGESKATRASAPEAMAVAALIAYGAPEAIPMAGGNP